MANYAGQFLGKQFGNYRLIRLLGQGGFAEVYLGEHIYLNTQAAVKVLTTRLTDEEVLRFRSEARTIMALQHPNIVQILDFSVEAGIPCIIMRYAPRGSLRQRYPEGTRVPLIAVVTYVKQVAAALQHVHNQKMVHRDVKPENMLIGADEEILLSDFGIAAVAHSTQSAALLDKAGTIAYMAPEQMQGRPRPASDQYSLAVVAYRWLTGIMPFQGTTLEIMTQHLSTLPPPLRERIPAILPQVEQVVLKALEKDPHRRFENIQMFARALEQASAIDVSSFSKLPQFDASALDALPALYSAVTPTRHSTVYTNPPATTHYKYQGHSAAVNAVAWSPDGLRLASASTDRSVQVWDAANGGHVLMYSGHKDTVRAVAWSPDAAYLASAGVDMSVQVWDAVSGQQHHTFRGHSDSVHAVAWSPDSRFLASASRDKSVRIWDMATGGEVLVYGGHSHSVFALAWSPDGTSIASGGYDKTVQIWSANNGAHRFTFRDHNAPVNAVTWFSDSSYIASASGNDILVWSVSSGEILLPLKRSAAMILALSWSPNGSRLASASGNIVSLWDMTTGMNVLNYSGHSSSVLTLAWSFDSTLIASGGSDKTVRVWQAM